jgi:hypothetical protein
MSNNIPDDLQTTFKKRGIKTKADSAEVLNFIGKNARTPFALMVDRMVSRFSPSTTDVATLGEAYDTAYYKTVSGSREKDYESVYGGVDYSVPVTQDSRNKETLDEIFGNNDNDPTGSAGGIGATEAKEIIGLSGTTKFNTRGLKEKHVVMVKAQQGTVSVLDEDSAGVRGPEDKDASIDSIS